MKRKLRFFCENRVARITAIIISVLITSLDLAAQSRQISGTVKASDDQSTLPGVSVVIKGTANGTTTDSGGRFTLNVNDDNAVLVISSIGYSPHEEVVGSRTEINISLTPDVKTLEEIVVIGYGTQKREDVTGAISSVTGETIEKIPVTRVDQALQGRAAGVQIINNDAAPSPVCSPLFDHFSLEI